VIKNMIENLPKIQNEIDPRNIIINATPDGRYAVRILEYYRLRCNEKWIVTGVPENERAFYDAMNETQDKRAKELGKAIAMLRSNLQ
jgi:hypothetical protein